MSAKFGITHWYAVMEPTLNRLLQRFNADLKPIGPAVDYYGIRQPCFDTVDDMLARAFQKNRDIWDLVTDEGKIWPVPQEEQLSGKCQGRIFNRAQR
jgi:N-acyl amino acid synthase of PEP-CTERM/exosortase system